jgi:hypothetical protein
MQGSAAFPFWMGADCRAASFVGCLGKFLCTVQYVPM